LRSPSICRTISGVDRVLGPQVGEPFADLAVGDVHGHEPADDAAYVVFEVDEDGGSAPAEFVRDHAAAEPGLAGFGLGVAVVASSGVEEAWGVVAVSDSGHGRCP
jgi:hypothetical protein